MSDAPERIWAYEQKSREVELRHWSKIRLPNSTEYTRTDLHLAMVAAEREALAAVIEELEAKLVKAVARAEVADETLDKAIDASRVLIAKMKDRTDDQWRREIRGKANRGEKDE